MAYYFSPPKSPHSPEALTVSDIRPGVKFAVMNNGEVVKVGTFLDSTKYDEDEWSPVEAEIEPAGEIELVGMYETGIVCSRIGEWPTLFTVERAIE